MNKNELWENTQEQAERLFELQKRGLMGLGDLGRALIRIERERQIEEYRQEAIGWSLEDKEKLNYETILEMYNHFEWVVKEYPELKEEFEENAII